jgi:hypothetical protein
MAIATYVPTTSSSNINKIWRKVQGELQPGFQYLVEEWELLDDLKNFQVDWSAREITVPIDISDGAGIASIQEGGYEARPYTPNVQEIQFTWTFINGRFTTSRTAKYIDQLNPEAELKRQLVYQGMKKIQDIARHFGDYFWGTGNAYLAINTTSATQTSGTYTLGSLYGNASYNLSSMAGIIADKFRVNDYVALISGGALIANAIGIITAVNTSTPSITVTWNGSVTTTGVEFVVKSNSLGNTLVTDTDYQNGLTGMLDFATSTTIHNLSSASVPRWAPQFFDTSGGRFSGVRLHKGRDQMFNTGGGKLNTLLMDQGVYRDLLALQQAALRFTDPFALEIDGDIKSKGIGFFKTRRALPATVLGIDKGSFYRMTLLPKPSEKPVWDDGFKLQDQSGYVFPIDFPCQLVCTNRANMVYWQGLATQ